ncbi:spermidine synthase [Porphyrobacter sp. AAP82]|uniref:spermidine synthase n=1 Tax=Porphyrobacter sp. AAP82 TaxID=1248917 RepID=UPI00036D7DE3|nr:fused MFS/spermidine synthase [Porphyrobacter sp. AAP82]
MGTELLTDDLSGAPAASPRRWLFAVTILTGSFLLFLVQPLVARLALPRLGGAPNVWNSAMLVYQALLLGGYAYAHALSRPAVGRQALVHLALLVAAAFTLPIALPALAPPEAGQEALWVPWLFLLTIGPVFFVVSAQAPLMQQWFAAHPKAGDPYPLYAASNLGSFAGLLAYPLLVEPLLPLVEQSRYWAFGYGALVLLVALVALARRTAPAPAAIAAAAETAAGPAPDARRIALWLALSAVPSGLMLSTTTHLTTDIFAMPLLWVIPLGLYLLSFSIAFAEKRGAARIMTLAAPVVIAAAGALAMLGSSRPSLLAVAASLTLLFVVAVALHARLYEDRPEPARLTQFYLVMSAGGVLGGLFTALIAPLVFDWTWEHPILILAAAALLPLGIWSGLLARLFPSEQGARLGIIALLFALFIGALRLFDRSMLNDEWGAIDLAIFAALILAAVLLAARRWAFVAACAALIAALGAMVQAQTSLAGLRSRSYFGIYTVRDGTDGLRQLIHGTTLHGVQRLDDDGRLEPTTYYGREAGVGLALAKAPALFGEKARIGVVGLGVGTLACYKRPGQTWTFFEIDPAVLAYSTRGQFTFMNSCAPQAPTIIGDARLQLEKLPAASFDILVVDAFSSDAIPLHLMTREAQEGYFRTLAPDGLLLMHISNRFIRLEPVLSALAKEGKLSSAVRIDIPTGQGQTGSTWVAMSRDPALLRALTADGKWRPLASPAAEVWRDDYASILPHLIWTNFH